MMVCYLIALYKEPGVRPVGISKIIRKLLAKSFLLVNGTTATAACGNLNICDGLGAGIEGAVCATLGDYRKARSQPTGAWEVEADKTPLLTQPPTPEMPSLGQGDDTGDYWSREGSVEG